MPVRRRPRPISQFQREHFTKRGKPKRPYPSHGEAANFLRMTKQAARKRPYLCKICKHWHVGDK